MKTILLFLGIVVFLFSGFQTAGADDSRDMPNESLIHYYHKNKEGKNVRDIYITSEDMPPKVRAEPKECWWDYNEFMRCHPVKKKDQNTEDRMKRYLLLSPVFCILQEELTPA